MLRSKKLAILMTLALIAPMILAACGATPEPERVVETVVVEQTKIVEKEGEVQTVVETIVETVEVEKEVQVEVEVTPTPEPVDRMGGWLDMIVFLEEPSDEAAITRLGVGEMDVYAYDIANADLYQTVQGMDELAYTFSYGSYRELTFNPAPVEGDLNPFTSPKLREAFHWLVDRDYIVEEIYGGLARARYTLFNTVFPDYARLAGAVREQELKYAHDPDKAQEIITTEMEAMGAELVDGKWVYEGEPVDIIFIIRTEDKRREIGDYVANLLEEVGFTVDRQYKTGAEASVLWVQSDPYDGLWHLYTAGWGANYVNRNLATNFDFFFTPRGYSLPLWQAYTPSDALDTCADRLNRNEFSSLEEREALMAECLPLSMEDAVRVFLVDESSFVARRVETEVTSDLAAAVAGGRMNPYTMRFVDEVGGAMTVGMPSILTNPWNPVGGSNWLYDAAVQRACQDYGMMVDPFTGLRYPQRIERAEVTLVEGLPAGRGGESEDWLTVEYAPEIVVPDDAWVDWDAENEVFITAAEKFTETATALQKTVVYYPPELYQTMWHDGSPFSVGDIVMNIIMFFARGTEGSAIYDASVAADLQAQLASFKGVRIVSTDPLVIETYQDNYNVEAELIDQDTEATWYPTITEAYQYGTAAWHSAGLGVRVEETQELAFTSAKSTEMEVDWMNYIGGPSLQILAGQLISATEEGWIPFEPTLGQFVTEEEAAQRWENYEQWYDRYGHFWIGTGPYYLSGVFPVEGTVIAKHNPAYIDPANRWSGYTTPKISEVEIDGPGRVTIGEEAVYDLYVTFQGEPYPLDELDFVSYLVLDATGAPAISDTAEAVEDGLFQITLSAEQTSELVSGANKIEAVVVSKAVAIPSSVSFEFVTQ
ncbi:MAG: ABC transporter substrate-binding protein [Anaerolineae bacterium]|jgi:peptide/nickel transport system substrate-binding protein